jgi:hypothetical protein
MSDDEFELLDELYFLQHYEDIKNNLDWGEEKLLITLKQLLDREWIKCYFSPEEEVFEPIDLVEQGKGLYYLATKKGLLEHNSL